MSLLKHQEKKKQSSAVQCNANHQPYTLLLLLPHPFSTFNTRHDAVCLPERNHIRSFARSNAMPTHWKRDAKVYSHTHRERERERERERFWGEREGGCFFFLVFLVSLFSHSKLDDAVTLRNHSIQISIHFSLFMHRTVEAKNETRQRNLERMYENIINRL